MLELDSTTDLFIAPCALYRGAPFLKSFSLLSSQKGPLMLARQIMSQPVAACKLSDHADQAAKLMWEADCGVVPVLDDTGRAVAMLTDRDICMAAYTQGKAPHEIEVSSAMSKELQSCHPEDTLERVEQQMMQYQLRRIPVLDQDGRPVGILSLNDLARAANLQHPAAPAGTNGLSLASTAKTLAAVCALRLHEAGPRLA